jgi:hypothetical protein
LGCYEAGNAQGFPAGVCQLRVDQSLIDLCGVCFGDFASCFFQTVVPSSTVGAITGGAVAGIVLACIIAAAIVAWFSKKGYDYYAAQGALNSTGLHNNPAFQAHQNEGQMPDRLGETNGSPRE